MPSKNPPVGPNPQQGNVEDPNAQPAGGRPTTTILPGPVAPGPTTTIIPPVGGVSSVVLPSSSSAGTGGDTAPPVTNLTGVGAPPTGNYKAPHWVMYTDLSSLPKDSKIFPSAAQLKGVNRFILCFWVTENGGAFDNLLVWKEYPREKRRKILDEYHAAGIALMMAYGGDTEAPVTRVTDPVKTATDIAAYVKEYELDGVDVNYEELRAFSLGTAEAWVISFHKTLRSLLPRSYLISHAPVAPWFTTSPSWPGGGYLTVDKAVGEGIDWYNIQFYNQQDKNRYDTCDSLFNAATDWGAGSAVFEIHTKGGISLDKLVVGKPMSAKYQISSGLMDFATLGSCVKAAKAKQWTGGVMLWQMDPADLPAITTTFTAIRGDSWPV
ncbi:glycoside hydrolase family 18 protein [Dioszegia hungarica]|uniref:Glycoside hydrolase family 18 protein n=1 Tax=Dioszegia hungarica TaxID=4972 RepID=A0AA38HDV9_9TREE|nr:glycoside hydrolase family 18 protein [Dioszegia hungarica]KAI9638613.1 glycoside hydrolase family 18 protein [Dioszegia hungarica]